MAAETLSDLSDALSQTFAPELYKQWNRMAVLASMIEAQRGLGKNAAFDTEFSGATAATVAEGADVSDGELASDVNVPAVFDWCHYRSSFKMSETEIDAAASSIGSADALMDLFADRVMGCGAKIASLINADLYTGDGTDGSGNNQLIGLFGGALEASGLYGTINRSTYTEWKGNVLDASSGPLTMDLLYHLEQLIFVASGERPSMIVASPGIYRKYAGLFESVRRLSTDGRGPLQYNAGADELFWKGIPVVRDKDCGTGKLAMLTPRHFKVKYLPRVQNPMDAVLRQDAAVVGSNGSDVKTVTGIPMRIAILAKTGDSVKCSLKATIAMCNTRPAASGYITGISES